MLVPRLPPLVSRHLPNVVGPLGLSGVPLIRRFVSQAVINDFGYMTTLRPRALSLASDYTSWQSLTDRSFSGRHLPPATPEAQAALPPETEVVDLFRRKGFLASTDTSVMFMFFAQWFTDSFLRTSRTDYRKNESNHEIDLCQIYGVNRDKTELLRAHQDGRLKSQVIKGEEYPPFLFEPREEGGPLVFKPEFEGLHDPVFITDVILRSASDEQKDTFFAVGLEHGNSTIGNTAMNIVFLREHNRVAAVLTEENPDWDDDRIFETTRNIMIVLLLKLVVEEYISHIAPFEFAFETVPFLADNERWNRTNWIAIEFNLLYRWHSLVPDTIGTGSEQLDATGFRNNKLVLAEGVEALLARCSRASAGKIALGNTPAFLVNSSAPGWPSVEEVTVDLMRKARLRSFNEYRKAYKLRPLKSFEELTADAKIRERLKALYGHIDQLEWYVGIFAEDYPDHMMMGELMTVMVANDAFTQALTNPLLARNVFTDATFTKTGMEIIADTGSLQEIVARNSKSPTSVHVSFRHDATQN
ncbi:peroxidase family protein [Streptomyces griseoloalbus]|uniref:peroxidase family protein n=1 Tax=Streptomyces griseoloalbus TaxID=67303 RepID=UPI0033B0FBBD